MAGMRPGEVCSMRPADIDTSGDLWIHRPIHHKTAHHGHERHDQAIAGFADAQATFQWLLDLEPRNAESQREMAGAHPVHTTRCTASAA